MIKYMLLGAAALAMSGCAGFRDRATNYICTHQVQVAAGARATIAGAPAIKDPETRQTAIDAANALLDAVAACPPSPAPTPTPSG